MTRSRGHGVSEVSARVAELAGDRQAAQDARRTWAATSASQKVRAHAAQGGAEADGGQVALVLTLAPEATA
jgi:hypothetical protein